jgi:hypothetical protein
MEEAKVALEARGENVRDVVYVAGRRLKRQPASVVAERYFDDLTDDVRL